MATQVYDGEIGSRRRCEKKSKEGRKGCVELSVYLLGQRAANSRDATVFYDWEPTEAIIALERLKRKSLLTVFKLFELQQERKHGDGAFLLIGFLSTRSFVES
jgi:hypothetical protein